MGPKKVNKMKRSPLKGRSCSDSPHHYAYFVQFDWLEKKFYSSINSVSTNQGTIFLPRAHKMFNNVEKNMILMTNGNYKEQSIIFVDFINV